MPLTREELIEMRVSARLRIEAEFREFREVFFADAIQTARKGELKAGIEQGIQGIAQEGSEPELRPEGEEEEVTGGN